MQDSILDNLGIIRNRIRTACTDAGRNISEVKLLLATKTVSADRIVVAIRNGSTLIAENKVQELKLKYEALKTISHTSHFIGHLQTNKIKDILKYGVSCVQSVDRLDLAEKLHQKLSEQDRTMEILVQVNTSEEESKFGVLPENAIELVKQIQQFSTLKIRGLMTIGRFSNYPDVVRPCFKLLKQVQQEISALDLPNVQMKELSMGMSNDLEIAIQEGATIVRVGTAVFGQRQYPDSYYWNEGKK